MPAVNASILRFLEGVGQLAVSQLPNFFCTFGVSFFRIHYISLFVMLNEVKHLMLLACQLEMLHFVQHDNEEA
jgi:hypothetical protein